MKIAKRRVLGTLATVVAGLVCVPAVRDEIHWQLACLRDTDRAYRGYEKVPGKHRHDSEASLRSFRRRWLAERPQPKLPEPAFWCWAWWEGSAEDYQEFLDAFPRGRMAPTAQVRIERIRWAEAERANTVAAYQQYIDDAIDGARTRLAEARQKELQRDDAPFLAAKRQRSPEAWAQFLQDFRGHRRSGEALAKLAEAEPDSIFELARTGKLTISGEGWDLYRFGVVLHKHRTSALPVSVPQGLYWKAQDPRVQDMVATHGFDHKLDQDGDIWCSTPAAGAGMRKRLATAKDKFTLLPSPPNADLARLIAFFAFKMPEFRLRQAAIWVVTDNATWDELKQYMYGQTGAEWDIITGDEEKIFDTDEVANVLQIIEAAGLDVTRYALWKDKRGEIFWNLVADGDARWLTFSKNDPQGVGRAWEELKTRVASRLSGMESRFARTLKARPFDIVVRSRSGSPESAWLGWYLRELGHDVSFALQPDGDADADSKLGGNDTPNGTTVWADDEFPQESKAIAELIERAFALKGRSVDTFGISFSNGGMDMTIVSKGTNEKDRDRKLLDHTPKWLRWIP